MTIRANRVQFIWSPLVGWALLAGTVSNAAAQINITPPGGVTAPATTPDNTAPAGQPGASTGTPATGTIGTPADTTSATPAPASNVPAPSLPPGTSVQNPSTQLVPGTSDIISGINAVGPGGVATAGAGELGVSVGAFTLFPQLDVAVGYDTNVFAQNGNQSPVVASLYTTIQPALALRSEWLNHSLNFLMAGGFGFYEAAPTQNYQNYILMADGRIDVREDTYVTWSGGYKRATEALGSPNVAFAQAPTVDNSIPLTLGITHRFNRVTVDANATASKLTYIDYSTITSQGLSAENRNRMEYGESVRIGYEMSDDLTLYVQPSLSQIRYDLPIDTLGQARDSDGLTFNGGAVYTFSPTSKLDGSVGYTSLASQSGQGTTSAMSFGLSGSWNGYEPLVLRPTISRSINQTALSNYQNYISTVVGLEFSYVLHNDWTAVGGFSYTTADYTPFPGVAGVSPRTDYFVRASLGLLYALRPQVSIGPVFEYTSGSSTDPVNGQFFTRELFSIRLIARR